MVVPEDVRTMLELQRLGLGLKGIARTLKVSRNTVRRYLRCGGWAPYSRSRRQRSLDGLEAWLREQYARHRGNAEVVRQELQGARGIEVSLRTVERAVAGYRKELQVEAKATVRFETPPGAQLQGDFGEQRILIGGEPTRVHLFVGTLGFSRRVYVRPFRHERVESWQMGIEGAFQYFAGVSSEVLVDNARPLVKQHDVASREVVFTDSFHAFARYWGFQPKACAPYRARTKGKDERSVGYVKRNALAGREFDSWGHLEAHLSRWMREVADLRIHGSTGERPIDRFEREEAAALRPLGGRAPFVQHREVYRKVHTDLCVELDTNRYSVPWRLIGEQVTVQSWEGRVRILHAGQEVASHAQPEGRYQRVEDRSHFAGLASLTAARLSTEAGVVKPAASCELLRPLKEYEVLTGGRW